MLNKVFKKYTGFLRSFKAVYVLNNLLNSGKLKHNRSLYKRYGLRKSIYSPIAGADFPTHSTEIPWLDQADALVRIETDAQFLQLAPEMQNKVRQFINDGYCVLEDFFPSEQIDALNAEVDALLASGKTDFNYTGRKIFNLHEDSALANEQFFRAEKLTAFLSFLLGKKVIPFQTLGFTMGSEQRAHSDFIHMSTEPQGYLIACWIALENCTPDNGPLFYYPGSHRLPYVTTADYDSGNTFLTVGAESNRRYEDKIAAVIAEHNLVKRDFLAQKGDVLIWHANLLHGGNPILRKGATRRSLVCHYFSESVICFHEMSQRPALLQLGQPADK